MKFAASFVLAVATVSCASGVYWDGLRVTWGPSVGNGFYDPLPRLVNDAVKEGWLPVGGGCENGGRFAGHRYRLGNDTSLNLLFDKNGIIAGIQALLPKSEVMNPENDYRYDLVPMFQNETISGAEYVVLTAYFVQPQTICSTGRTLFDFMEQGTGTGVYFQNGESPTGTPTIDVPSMRADASAVGWTNCECFPGMGLHNFFEVEKWAATNCTTLQPTQATFNLDEELTGFVFQIQGPHLTSTRYETPPNEALYAIIGVDRIPQCVVDSNTRFGSSTMHIYFIDQPWLLGCTK
jgi:charged multivesicular body protein 7